MKTTTNRRKLDSTFRNDSLSSDQSECLQQQRPPPPKPHKHKQKGVAGNNSQSASHSHSSQQSLISAQQHQSQHQQQRQAHQQIYRQIFFRSHFFLDSKYLIFLVNFKWFKFSYFSWLELFHWKKNEYDVHFCPESTTRLIKLPCCAMLSNAKQC